MKEKRDLIVHVSDSDFGDAALIDSWHKERGFDEIGYNFVILNGHRKKGQFEEADDGIIEPGRSLDKMGAHCKENNKAIGLCIIGKRLFSARQLYYSMPKLVNDLQLQYDLNIFGHYEFNNAKTCPNMNMFLVRNILMLYNNLSPRI